VFLDLFAPLVKFFSPFNVFRYLTFRGAYAALTALLICFLFGPSLIQKLKRLKLGQEVRTDGPKTHLVKGGTPTMGGLLMIIAVSVSVLVWEDLHNAYTWVSLLAVIGFGGIGFLDDYLKISRKSSDGLSAGLKFGAQIVIAFAIVLILYLKRDQHTTLLYLPFFKNAVCDLSWGYIPIAVIFIVGFSNAVNLTDGLDGLATGLSIMVLIALAIILYLTGRVDYSEYLNIPYIKGSGELVVLSLSLLGACTGFLWFNAHPAEVFMGDTGSLMLGGVMATLALIVKKEVLLLILGGVFVIEVASDVIQVGYFKLTKKRVFKMAPLHHHFELKGWDETKVVARFWILGGLFAIIGLSTLKIQ
jgi:phospho-N-acetylmuramoyl-pentapeptide-transferase